MIIAWKIVIASKGIEMVLTHATFIDVTRE